jgi:UDP-2,4-diacetamido-2,4,6-trideoxy-beta-L-altropyranose hydrolase
MDKPLFNSRPIREPNVLLRADAGQDRGYGHVMRCVTLGAELRRRGWAVTLLAKDLNQFLEGRATAAGIIVRHMNHLVGSSCDAAEVVGHRADIVVVDGYGFTEHYFQVLEQQAVPYVVIDDNGDVRPRRAMLVINQNPHADASMYPGHDPGRLLLGTKFALVRSEVTRLVNLNPPSLHSSAPSVLVSIGGTDIGSLTRAVTEALLTSSALRVTASLAHPPAGVSAAPPDIAIPLSQATVAVIGAGSTLWEACVLGVPAVALVVADNQVGGSQKAAAFGACEVIDCRHRADLEAIRYRVTSLLDSPLRRSALALAGRQLVDGDGASRVALAIEGLSLFKHDYS